MELFRKFKLLHFLFKCYKRKHDVEVYSIMCSKEIFSDDDFIGAGLGGMGYNHRSYKRIISNCKFIRGQFQTIILKK
jgi:hypothetical protein